MLKSNSFENMKAMIIVHKTNQFMIFAEQVVQE